MLQQAPVAERTQGGIYAEPGMNAPVHHGGSTLAEISGRRWGQPGFSTLEFEFCVQSGQLVLT